MKSVCLILFLLFGVAAWADSVTVDFTTHYDSNFGTFDQVASAGTLNLTLNSDGTIAADLSSNVGDIPAFGAQTGANSNLHNISNSDCRANIAETLFGAYDSGLGTRVTCGSALTFTIGTAGEFSSVNQLNVLSGLDGSSVTPFFLYANTQQFENPQQYGATFDQTPEPSSLVLLGSGLLGIGGIIRRRLV